MEKKGKQEEGGPLVRKRERFRMLINLIGKKQDQDSTEVWEEKSRENKEEEPQVNSEGTGANKEATETSAEPEVKV